MTPAATGTATGPETMAALGARIAASLAPHFPADTLAHQQVLALAEETGEFTAAYRRWAGLARRTGTRHDMTAELADVAVTAYVTAAVLGIDLDTAIPAKTAVIFARGWRDQPADRPEGTPPMPAAATAVTAVTICQALGCGPVRNLHITLPSDPAIWDPCTASARAEVTVSCPNGHTVTWHVCPPCATIITSQASRVHAHCPACRTAEVVIPAVITITPPGTPITPPADPGCARPGCPERGDFWACHRCGDAYCSTSPESGLCPDCTDNL
jgi:NTP pyrophosphatase (non-canonical NTP hydrolase)